MTHSRDSIVRAAERTARDIARELERLYGWTHLEAELSWDAEQQVLRGRGTVLARGVARKLAAGLTDALPDGVRFDLRELGVLRSGDWHALGDGLTPVWQKHPSRGRVLATELLPEEGPVELLATHEGSRLVRGVDGTLGWIERELGPSSEPPRIAPAHGTGEQVVASARALLDAPYRLGGTTAAGVDCSGLCQRAYREGLGVILPRHSLDQLAATLHFESSPRQSGDLVFVWSEREGPCHVGLMIDPGSSVIHASHSRRRVVEDPWDRFIDQSSRVELVAIAHTLDYHARNVGRSSLELVDGWEEP